MTVTQIDVFLRPDVRVRFHPDGRTLFFETHPFRGWVEVPPSLDIPDALRETVAALFRLSEESDLRKALSA